MALVNDAVDQLYRKDSSLIRRKAREVTISHRLAVYLEQLLRDRGESSYDVDIEYNRNMAGTEETGTSRERQTTRHHRPWSGKQ